MWGRISLHLPLTQLTELDKYDVLGNISQPWKQLCLKFSDTSAPSQKDTWTKLEGKWFPVSIDVIKTP